jgi:ketosteroid isomerase-like protein
VSRDPALQRLVDLEAIRDLARRYAHAVWQKDADAAADLFTEDGVMDTGDRAPLTGREALRETYSAMFGVNEFHPMIHNHVVELEAGDAGRAYGTCYIDLEAVIDGIRNRGHGFYRDRYVRVGDGWKFESRTLCMDRLEPVRF